MMARHILAPLALSRAAATARSARRGISLLEVLISMFVLTVGILGVAALIPLGRFETSRANRADRASAVGRAAFREFAVRDMVNMNRWLFIPPLPPNINPYMQTIFCDPLGVATGLGHLYNPTDPVPRLCRVTLRATIVPGPNVLPILWSPGMADEVFRSRDDLFFEAPKDPDLPVAQKYSASRKRQSEGNYSWAATIQPDPISPGVYTVSVVVFYRRALTPLLPSERYLGKLDFQTGWGGGEAALTLENISGPEDIEAVDGRLRPRRWLLVGGSQSHWTPADVNKNGLSDDLVPQSRWSWYRIGSVRPVMEGDPPNVRVLSLIGPDWTIAAPSAAAQSFQAATGCEVFAVADVVAVYEKQFQANLTNGGVKWMLP